MVGVFLSGSYNITPAVYSMNFLIVVPASYYVDYLARNSNYPQQYFKDCFQF